MNATVTKIKPEPEAPADPLAKLREPFPPHQVSKLPKESKTQADERKADRKTGINCQVCGGWHHRNAVHLDYVGHAALTDRLLDTDPLWSWEPLALRDGLPAFDQTGGLWIKLTVCGVTRLGYGHAAAKPQMDPGAREKEVIGDALRNAAMRFGAALDLWHKGDLHVEETSEPDNGTDPAAERGIAMLRDKAKDGPQAFKAFWEMNRDAWKTGLTPQGYASVVAVMKTLADGMRTVALAPAPEPDPFASMDGDDIPDFAR